MILWHKPICFKGNYIDVDRVARQKFIHLNFAKYLRGKILDVGNSNGTLGTLSDNKHFYVAIDFTGTPSIIVDLEEGRLPFRSNTFDCVVCADVLEHINNLHTIFDEIFRVSSRYVIISVPNMQVFQLRWKFLWGRKLGVYYGLPEISPSDRHRWFFNLNEAETFFEKKSVEKNAPIIMMFPYYGRKSGKLRILNPLLKIINKFGLMPNFFAMVLWIVFEKRS